MMLLLPIALVLAASFLVGRHYLPQMSLERRAWVLYLARFGIASAFAFIASRGHPTAIMPAILFAIFAWRSRPAKPLILR